MAIAYFGPDRRHARPSPTQLSLAVTGLAAVAFVTLCPIGLRPHVASANLERFWTYAVLGLLVSRAAGRRWMVALAALVLTAVTLEAAQRLVPGRHARLSDASIKALGAAFGCLSAQLVFPMRRLLAEVRAPAMAAQAPDLA